MSPVDCSLLLSRYRISCLPMDSTASSGSDRYALTGSGLGRLVQAFGVSIQSPDARVTGSLFMKRCCSLVSGVLYAWTHHQASWDAPLTGLQAGLQGQGLTFQLPVPLIMADGALPILDHLMIEWTAPLLREVARLTGIREANLWATLSYNLAYWEREWLREATDAGVRLRVQEAFGLLRSPGSLQWFPGCPDNPLGGEFRQVPNPYEEDKPILIRSSCCMNYRLPGEDRYCYTCPLLCGEQRMAKVEALYNQKAQTPVR